MPPVIIVVELLGEAGPETYQRLTVFMQDTLGWDTELTAAHGVKVSLPVATYTGQTGMPLIDLADTLKSQIAADVWPGGSKVLVLRWLEWAQSATK